MYIGSHLEKVERIETLLARLDPLEDFELWAWMCMTAATHAVNAALHRLGSTREDGNYSYHVIGLYVVPPRENGRWQKKACPPGDIVHVDAPPAPGRVPAKMAEAYAALRRLEDLREPYVRGAEPVTRELVERTREAYRTCIARSVDAQTEGTA